MMLNGPSHRRWNDLKKAMVDTGRWPFILVMVVFLNLDYGPWDGSSFHQRGVESMQSLLLAGGLAHPFVRHYREMILDLGWWHDRHDPDLGPRLLAALETFLVKS